MGRPVITWLIVAHLVAGTAALAVGTRLGRWTFALAAAPSTVAVGFLATRVPQILDGTTPTTHFSWVGALRLDASFRLDGFALMMAMLVTGVASVVLVYSSAYFASEPSAGRVVRFCGTFTLFTGTMLGLVVADDVWTLFAFWELTSVLSFLLIGLDDHVAEARRAAQRALLVTGAGGLAMLGGLACLVHEAGTADLQGLLATAPTSTTAQVGLVLVLVGAFSKSAQVPFHFWLPGAMAAPTPVSAFLHSATMVKAGVIVIAQLSPAFADIDWWRPVCVVVGGTTMLAGGVAALRRDDAKQALAFGTVSQLGLLVVLFGVGEHAATAAGVSLLLAHALFKSGLFLTIGAVDHATGTRDLARLSGVGRSLPALAVAAGLCTLSMIGIPPLLGFAAKESALAALADGTGWATVALVVVVVGSVLTTAYSVRIWWGLFATKPSSQEAATVHHAPSPLLIVPVMVLAALSLAAGLAAGPLGRRLQVAAHALDANAHLHLTLAPGFHLPLLLSAAIVAAGIALAVVLTRRTPARAHPDTLGERAFGKAYDGLLEGARKVTLITQSGSLPVYVAVIFAVVVLSLGVALARGAADDLGHPVFADSALQAAVAILGIVVSLAVVMARRRFVSVLLLGGVGQSLTVLFLLYGAPDLALTQFMIETLSIIAFVLVLRHLPRHHTPPPSWAPRTLRIGFAFVVGVAVSWFTLAAGSVDRPTDVTDAVEELSLPAAGGRNVVNVTIVDFRGIDTIGEITVFGIAALGVANLVAATRRGSGASARLARIGAQSMIFEQVTRMVFHTTLLVSLYVMLRGHNAPGGGFAGGLVAGAAFVFRVLAGETQDRSFATRISPVVLIATGMLLAIGTGFAPLLVGNEFLESSLFHLHLPLIGDLKLVSAGVFDLGVYLLVIGVVIMVIGQLASRTHRGAAARSVGST